jgi:HAD superfamily hydrolase (TIGR01662 family)
MTTPPPALSYSVVIPTLGRRSLTVLLEALLEALQSGRGPRPEQLVVVDDRPLSPSREPLDLPAGVRVLPSGGRGPAAARNVGWRAVRSEWVAFLDDDVVAPADWPEWLAADLGFLAGDVAGSQARLVIPLPAGRRPTDWERSTAGLQTGQWITADMAYRRAALADVGGFDERFPRAFREDADLALRVVDAGWRLVRGSRTVEHPVRPADFWVSVRQQAGNADDALMLSLHGPHWHERAGAPRGRRSKHMAITAAGVAALLSRGGWRTAAAALWAAGTLDLAWARIRPGPRTGDELLRMLATSVAIPPAATYHWLRGRLRHRTAAPWPRPPIAVLFDRDGTLVHDVPYNTDPAAVHPVEGAREALDRLRAAGVRVGVVTNQSGVGRGLITAEQLARVNARIEELLGPFDVWQICPHGPGTDCPCRKPRPGMVLAALARMGAPPHRSAVVGDIGADVAAALSAGARPVLVPTPHTLREELAAAPEVLPDLAAAVDALLLGAATEAAP